jgi:hypothetical protein
MKSSHNAFVDRRTEGHKAADLATRVLFWYDEEGKGRKARRRTNGVAVTTDGLLIVSRASCSRKDQFIKKQGRLVVESRILGRAQKFCWVITLAGGTVGDINLPVSSDDMAEACAEAYREVFPDDDLGAKRCYNAGKVFSGYKADIERRANELDEF